MFIFALENFSKMIKAKHIFPHFLCSTCSEIWKLRKKYFSDLLPKIIFRSIFGLNKKYERKIKT